MSIADYDGCFALWQASEGIGLSASDNRDGTRLALECNPGLSFVAADNNEIVGSVLSSSDGRRGYLSHVAVADAYQRRGIGSRLVERALTALAALGIERAHVFVFANNAGAVEFWQRQGWWRRDDLVMLSRDVP